MDENQFPKLDRSAFSIAPLEEADSDEMAFWFSKTPDERQIFYGYDLATTRLQRVLEITERPKDIADLGKLEQKRG